MRSRTALSSSITSTVLVPGGAGLARRRRGRAAESAPRTSAGSRIVNVLPRPGSLVTVMSPPIIRLSRRESASPSPVPP